MANVKRQKVRSALKRRQESEELLAYFAASIPAPWRCTECFNSDCQCGSHECEFCGKV